jgi:hypothetical protein
MNLMDLWKELPAIAERADRERLSALWPLFEKEYPDLAAEFRYCATMEDSQTVLQYLNTRIPMIGLVRMTTPKFDQTIIFIHQYLKEKIQNGRASQDRDRGQRRLRAGRENRGDV